MTSEKFVNRKEAGHMLAEMLKKHKGTNAVVLAIPRGGIPVGYEIARKLEIPLDLLLVKKIGHPDNKEFAIGSASTDSFYTDKNFGVSGEYIQNEVKRIKALLEQRYHLYMGDKKPLALYGKTVILVDDGIATGNTILGGIKVVQKANPAKIIVASPVVPSQMVHLLEKAADEFIYILSSMYFTSVGSFYEDFSEVSDEEIRQMLDEHTEVHLLKK